MGMLFRFKRPVLAFPPLVGMGVEGAGGATFLGLKKLPSIWGAMLLRPVWKGVAEGGGKEGRRVGERIGRGRERMEETLLILG